MNVFKEKNQTTDFFAERLQRFEDLKEKNIKREKDGFTKKTIGQLRPKREPFSSPEILKKVIIKNTILENHVRTRIQTHDLDTRFKTLTEKH